MPEPVIESSSNAAKPNNNSNVTHAEKRQKTESAHDLLLEMVEGIRTHLKGVVSDLNDLSKTVSLAYREKRTTDKEIESIRESLNEIRKLRI